MKRVFLITAALVLALSAAAPAAADPVRVQAFRKADGAARMDFIWPRAALYQAEQNGRTVTVRFGREAEVRAGDFAAAVRRIPDFVRAAAVEADGRTVTVTLNRDAEVLDYPSGALVILEMLPLGPPDPPGTAAAAAPEPAAADGPPAVPVRAGLHTDKTRLVFDWPEKTGYSLQSENGVHTLTFESPARIDIAGFAAAQTRGVGAARTEAADGGTRVIFTAPPESQIRHFYSGDKIVVDVPHAEGAAPPPPSEAPAAEAETETAEAAEPETAPETDAASETAEAPSAPETPAPETPAPETSAPETAETGTETASETASETETAAPDTPETSAAADAPAADAPAADAAAAVDDGPVQLAPDVTERLEAAQAAAGGLKALAEGGASGASRRLRFSTGGPLGLAVFRRAGGLWLVFDEEFPADIIGVMRAGGDLVENVRQIPVFGATVLRLDTPEGINPDISLEGFDWVLEMKRQPAAILSSITVTAKTERGTAPRIQIAAAGVKTIITFTDPEVGDNLIVAPVRPVSQGVLRAHTYPQVRVRPTLQGVAIEPRADGVRVQPLGTSIEVTMDRGQLAIVSSDKKDKDIEERPLSRILDLEPWGENDLESFAQRRRDLLRAVTQASLSEKEEKWRELALFYAANAYGAEALGVLKIMNEIRPDIEEEAEFRMLRGIGRQLLGRSAEARADFEHESVQGIDEAVFWASVTRTGPASPMSAAAAVGFRERGRIPDPYPHRLRIPAALLALESVIVNGDVRLAERYLMDLRKQDVISRLGGDPAEDEEGGDGEDGAAEGEEGEDAGADENEDGETETADAGADADEEDGAEEGEEGAEEGPPPPVMSESEHAQLNYLDGLMRREMNETEMAIQRWEQAEAGPHRPTRVRAAVSRVETQLEEGDVSPADAIKEYEKLRFAWRGDTFEFNLLRRLGQLYMDENLYRDGLYALRKAVIHFQDREEIEDITEEMAEVFQALFLDGRADFMAPVTAIGIYQEFKELTPAGERGDELIRRLADRLVNVDLLPDAAALLENQVEFRLQGVDKARVGARLALVRIMNGEHQSAIDTLGATAGQDTPPELREQRRHLRARALVGLGQKEAALSIIESDESIGADLLRAEIFVGDESWPEAARAFRGLARSYGAAPRKPLDERQARAILDMATAFTLSGNERALGLLRANFGPQMTDSIYADAFKLISAPIAGLIDRSRVPQTVAQAAAFQTFLSEYKERLEDAPLSAIN